jgi:hypothetical protein
MAEFGNSAILVETKLHLFLNQQSRFFYFFSGAGAAGLASPAAPGPGLPLHLPSWHSCSRQPEMKTVKETNTNIVNNFFIHRSPSLMID